MHWTIVKSVQLHDAETNTVINGTPLTSIALKSLFFTVPALAIQSAVLPAVNDYSWVSQAEHTGLVGCLLFAVGVLWKNRGEELSKRDVQLADKDKQIITMVEHVTAAMISQVETNRELRKIIEESVKTKMELKGSIDNLANSLKER